MAARRARMLRRAPIVEGFLSAGAQHAFQVCSHEVSAVRDPELRAGPVLRGRSRIAANETGTETSAALGQGGG
jgi:hypothetical protein